MVLGKGSNRRGGWLVDDAGLESGKEPFPAVIGVVRCSLTGYGRSARSKAVQNTEHPGQVGALSRFLSPAVVSVTPADPSWVFARWLAGCGIPRTESGPGQDQQKLSVLFLSARRRPRGGRRCLRSSGNVSATSGN